MRLKPHLAPRLTLALLMMTGGAASPALAMDELALTVYNDGRALVVDERNVRFPAGRAMVPLPGVSSRINAPSVGFVADDISIVEQNYDFDLLSPQALMKKSVGETVTLVVVNPGTGKETRRRAKILAVNNGVVIESDGKIEVLRDDGIPTRVIFDAVPDNLRAQPTLSVTVDSAKAGTRPATLSYLTSGLSWSADYVAVFDEKSGKLDLQGWATMGNTTETSFKDAKIQLIAGSTNGSQRPRNAVRRGGVEATPEQNLGDYKLYALPGRTTLASNQTKQIGLVSANGVKAEKRYEYKANGFNSMGEAQNVDVRVAFSNSRAAGLNAALPAGVVRVYQRDSGGKALFAGEDRIGHVPGGSDLSLKIGDAFDVTVQPRVTNRNVINKRTTDTTMEYKVRNARSEPVDVVIDQLIGSYWKEVSVRSASLKHTMPNADSAQWTVPVPAEGEATLTFTIRTVSRY